MEVKQLQSQIKRLTKEVNQLKSLLNPKPIVYTKKNLVIIIVEYQEPLVYPYGVTIKEIREAVGVNFGLLISYETGISHFKDHEALIPGKYSFFYVKREYDGCPSFKEFFGLYEVPRSRLTINKIPLPNIISTIKRIGKKTRTPIIHDTFDDGKVRTTYHNDKYRWNCCDYLGQNHPMTCYQHGYKWSCCDYIGLDHPITCPK